LIVDDYPEHPVELLVHGLLLIGMKAVAQLD